MRHHNTAVIATPGAQALLTSDAMSATAPPIHLSVSIVLYNSPLDVLERVLQSLRVSAQLARQSTGLSRVGVDVVDNCSDPETRRQCRQAACAWPQSEFFQVRYCELPENRGFGAGHNSVLSSLESDFHLVLNPDAELAEDALTIGLSNLVEDPGTVLVSPRVAADDGHQEFLCKRYPSVLVLLLRAFSPRFIRRLFRRRLHHYEMRDRCQGDEETEIMLASGCFMLVRTAAIRKAGGFNEDFFLYFEDFDLSLRLGGQGRLVFNPAMRILHHGGYAARKGNQHVKYFIKSGITFFNRHGWRWI